MFSRINLLKTDAVWNFGPSGKKASNEELELTHFSRYNLIYGLNGSGKTTLTRIFQSIAAEQLVPALENTSCEFEFTTTDAKPCSSQNLRNPYPNNILVFNSDFILNNFVWDDARANPVVYLSEKEVGGKVDLMKLEKEEKSCKSEFDLAEKSTTLTRKTYDDLCTQIGKEINNSGQTQAYNRAHVIKDFADFKKDDAQLLGENDVKAKQERVKASALNPKLDEFNLDVADITNKIQHAILTVEESLSVKILDDVKGRETMLSWIAEGLHYHEDNALESCLFCANPLPDTRVSQLRQMIDGKFEQFSNNLDQTIEQTGEVLNLLRTQYSLVGQSIATAPNLRETADKYRSELQSNIGNLGQFSKQVFEALRDRKANPTRPILLENYQTELNELAKQLADSLSNLNRVIQNHNQDFDNDVSIRNEFRKALKYHFLNFYFDEYEKAKSDMETSIVEASSLSEKLEATKQEISELKLKLSDHGVAVDKINNNLKDYLGHGGIRISINDEVGYKILRENNRPANYLSEGEKTAIVFCYFLSLLEAEGRNIRELIVVIDDPISSLDTSALSYVYALTTRATKDCKQVFVLTHNLYFMQYLKRYYMGKNKTASKSEVPVMPASFFELQCLEIEGSRKTSLVDMDPSLTRYDSDYHYLFSLVYKEAYDSEVTSNPLILNACRQLIEIFSAFKQPNVDTIADMIKGTSSMGNLTASERTALERIVQIGSHGQASAMFQFNAPNLEERKSASTATMKFICEKDKVHHSAMLSKLNLK